MTCTQQQPRAGQEVRNPPGPFHDASMCVVTSDLGFGVAAPWLKVFDEPSQDRKPLLALHRNADDAIAGGDEVLAYAGVVIHGVPQLQRSM